MLLFSKSSVIFGCLLALLSSPSILVNGQGCKGGNTFGYEGLTAGDQEECSCIGTACTNDTCIDDMGGDWTDDCPACDPDECDPLAANEYDDPPCVGAPEAIDRFGKKMYRRRILEANKPQDSTEGVFCYLKVELCEGETQVTQGMDSGFGDYYRLAATPGWYDYTGTDEYRFSGMHNPTGARSYSPATPMNENNVQFIIKEATSGDGSYYDCVPGKNCSFGFSELSCMLQPGDEILMSQDPDHAGYVSSHLAYVPNFSREPGYGPYTINVIGQGVAITELNVLAISELLQPFRSDGNFSNIQVINYLWGNSYWSNAEWTWQETDSTDLARELMRDMAQYGIRFNLMHSISRELRPEAQYPRTDVTVIGEAFNLTNTTDQDPNTKWFVVGSSSYKQSIYPQILEWGFDMAPCPGAEKKGYPYCGTNALYQQLEGGADPDGRMRSELFDDYAEMEQVPNPPIEGLGQSECEICESECMETDPENPGPCKNMCHQNGLCEEESGDHDSHDSSSDFEGMEEIDEAEGDEAKDEVPSSHDHDSSSDFEGMGENSISELACGNDDFSTLCSLIGACDVDFEAPITVFAPNNAAFAELDAAVGGLDTVDVDILCGILSFHVVAGQALAAADLLPYCESGNASLLEMSNGVNARVKCTKGAPYGIKGGGNDEAANFVETDIYASDGVIHVIDNVMFFPQVMSGSSTTGDAAPSLRGIGLP